ncbi:hypothetical protein [Embleya sp. NPDC059237]|uniref:hypothetical protein n=1 Tax=Embleya sp. NPDC059237 TaxID=3346784 RepID=UPI0036760FE7
MNTRPDPRPPTPHSSQAPLGTRMVRDALGAGFTRPGRSSGTDAIAGPPRLIAEIIRAAEILDRLDIAERHLRSRTTRAHRPLDPYGYVTARREAHDAGVAAARREDAATHLRRLLTVYRRATGPDPTDPAT